MFKKSKDNIVRAVPLNEIEELVYNGYPSEEDLKALYENNFILIKITDNEYYFVNKYELSKFFPFKTDF